MPYIKVDPADAPVLPPEPWLFSPESGGILDANGNVAVLGEMLNLTGTRIIACVNACQGLPMECLKRVQQGKSSIIVADEVLNGQRTHWQLPDSVKT